MVLVERLILAVLLGCVIKINTIKKNIKILNVNKLLNRYQFHSEPG